MARRLGVLLNGMSPLLGRDLALRYIHKAERLRLLLADPEAAVEQLQERHDVYAEVVGVPPKPNLLVSIESSSSSFGVQTFRGKLEHFVQL